jgi:ribonuclease-3
VHDSAAKEAAEGAGPAIVSNQRLEFLGDALLGFVVARYLFDRYPEASEGELTLRKASLVRDAALAQTAERLGFGPLLVLGKGLAGKGGPTRSMLADAFEAFVACLGRAAGADVAAEFVRREHVEPLEAAAEPVDDPKTALQEYSQRRWTAAPRYHDRFEGPPHERRFIAEVEVEGERLAAGEGPSKKEAQRAAAARALAVLSERHGDVEARKLSRPVQSSGRGASKNLRP